MGVGALKENVANLIAFGKPAQTPAAIIAQGTTSRQKVVLGTLDDIAIKAETANVEAPAVLVVGDVVKLANTLRPQYADTSDH
jgi:siroheme synthase